MNTKSFVVGFTMVSAMFNGRDAAKNFVTKKVRNAKRAVLSTADSVSSFTAGANQAIKVRRGSLGLLRGE